MTIILYGIPNCDQVKKAKNWLDEHGIAFLFHDFKKSGLNESLIRLWLTKHAWTDLINRKGTTWRKLTESEQLAVNDEQSAIHCMLTNTSVIKRPVLVAQSRLHTDILVGFSEQTYRRLTGLTS